MHIDYQRSAIYSEYTDAGCLNPEDECFTWDNSSEGSDSADKYYSRKVFIPIVGTAPIENCWNQVDGAFEGDPTKLYTVKFDTDGEVDSHNSELLLPGIPVDVYTWIQGYPFTYKGSARVCEFSPLPPNKSFLIDGANAENINTLDGFVFRPAFKTDFRFDMDTHTFFQAIALDHGKSYTIFVGRNEEDPYFPYFPYTRSAMTSGFDRVRVLQDGRVEITLRNMSDSGDDPYLYTDGDAVDVPPPPPEIP